MAGKTKTDGALALQPLGSILVLQTGKDRYQQLSAARLKTARLAANWSPVDLAAALTDVLGVVVSDREYSAWEDGGEDFPAGVLPAAFDVMGISEAEVLGLGNPDVEQVNRLAVAVARVRALLNDPTALMRRATDLMEGTARPLLVLAVALAFVLRLGAAAGVPHVHSHIAAARRQTVVAARVVPPL